MDRKLNTAYVHVEQYGKTAKGRAELLKHLNGGKLSPLQAIRAKCYDCNGYYADVKVDCECTQCPIHPYMPYRVGGVKKMTRAISPELKALNAEKFKKRMVAYRQTQPKIKKATKGKGDV